MRIRILSDLHREFGPTDIPQVECDLILLAGDIATKQNALPWIHEISQGTPVAYICGNHEFYGDKLPRVTERLREATGGSHIHILENDSLTIHGWHIFGCTLWTDLALQGTWEAGAMQVEEKMNDYKRIRNSAFQYRKLRARDTRIMHLNSVKEMDTFLSCHDPKRSIVLTHHAPSILSLPPHQRQQLISCAYTSHLDEFILKHQPSLWVHGHIHCNSDYFIGSTRILANPQAYPGEENPKFIRDLVIDLPNIGH